MCLVHTHFYKQRVHKIIYNFSSFTYMLDIQSPYFP